MHHTGTLAHCILNGGTMDAPVHRFGRIVSPKCVCVARPRECAFLARPGPPVRPAHTCCCCCWWSHWWRWWMCWWWRSWWRWWRRWCGHGRLDWPGIGAAGGSGATAEPDLAATGAELIVWRVPVAPGALALGGSRLPPDGDPEPGTETRRHKLKSRRPIIKQIELKTITSLQQQQPNRERERQRDRETLA